jgi:predicted membrane chloride channel (bestrophin family)
MSSVPRRSLRLAKKAAVATATETKSYAQTKQFVRRMTNDEIFSDYGIRCQLRYDLLKIIDQLKEVVTKNDVYKTVKHSLSAFSRTRMLTNIANDQKHVDKLVDLLLKAMIDLVEIAQVVKSCETYSKYLKDKIDHQPVETSV